jgi:hypothetical protein
MNVDDELVNVDDELMNVVGKSSIRSLTSFALSWLVLCVSRAAVSSL